ncbi:MAG: suppressor of fused domain protein [Candidatus Pacebacteria bacterium]|nr:suppressor of fused domain protein [Candidatus Paceibacterota bacterium]
MNSKPQKEVSKSGIPILRHQQAAKPPKKTSYPTEEYLKVLDKHIKKYIGEAKTVFHELISEYVHLDVYFIEASKKRNFHTLVTAGMSLLPMNVPPGLESHRFAELLICLPASWPLSKEAFKKEANYWPVRQLKMLARLPHVYRTFLYIGHTVPNGNPPKPLANNTRFDCLLLLPPILFPKEFSSLKINKDKTVHFYALIPLYPEETAFKLDQGTSKLFRKLDQARVTELVDINRPSLISKKNNKGQAA